MAKHILFVETGSMLDEGIRNRLVGQSELQIVILDSADPGLLQKVASMKHDVIVLSEVNALDSIRNSEILRGVSSLKSTRVIIVRLEANILEVYDKQRLWLTHGNDLISLIKH